MEKGRTVIDHGMAYLGIELGSTRIKASLIDPEGRPLASGAHGWENRLVDGIWSYDLADAWKGIAACYADLAADVATRYQTSITKLAAMGFSGMMHGYLVLDRDDNLLVPFRTWRNNITGVAAGILTERLQFAMPQRWSIAHLYQAILNGEDHIPEITYMTTLSGYIHYRLSGNRVIGIGDASGMFPVDPDTLDYDAGMVAAFEALTAEQNQVLIPWKLAGILPEVLPAGKAAGTLSDKGALLIDPTGTLKGNIPLCPPEGDAGTGMVATNSIRERTGNVSAGTSVFAMLVVDKKITKVHPEIDIVVTPEGKQVGMAHSNNCTSDYDAWIELFRQASDALGYPVDTGKLYDTLLHAALAGNSDAGGLLHYSFISGEHVMNLTAGRPLFVRNPDDPFTLGNFMRSLLFTALCALRTGLDVLTKDEGISVDEIRGHGGFFKTTEVGQRIMAAATKIPVSLPETAGEGGAWGMALLAAYMHLAAGEQRLADFIDALTAGSISTPVQPDPEDVAGFNRYLSRYHDQISIEHEAVAKR